MEIRLATIQDLDTLIQLGQELHSVEKEFEPLLSFSEKEARQRYAQALKNTNALFLLAQENRTAVGYLYAHADKVEYFSVDKLECEVEVIFVKEAYRRKGVAHLLFQSCLEWAKTKNIFRMKTGIYAGNDESRKAFLKYGFVPYHATYILPLT